MTPPEGSIGPVSTTAAAPIVVLGHGASGTSASMRPHVDGLAARGIEALAIDLPRGSAERAVGAYRSALPPDRPLVIGGHSFGGRVSTLLAAGDASTAIRGLVLFSFPLHRPGAPETWHDRVAHFGAIRVPCLFLCGASDPFAQPDLLRQAVATLPQAELVSYPGARHGLRGRDLEDALDRVAAFVRATVAT